MKKVIIYDMIIRVSIVNKESDVVEWDFVVIVTQKHFFIVYKGCGYIEF